MIARLQRCFFTTIAFGLCGVSHIAAEVPGDRQSHEAYRVLVFYSYGPDAAPFDRLARTFRQRLSAGADRPVEFVEYALPMATHDGVEISSNFIQYFREHLSVRSPELIVAVGGPAAVFCAKYRETLFPEARQLVLGIDEHRLGSLGLSGDVCVFGVRIELSRLLDNIVLCFPATETVHIVFGTTPFEQYWEKAILEAFRRHRPDIEYRTMSSRSLAEMREHVAGLEKGEVVFFGILNRDALGVSHPFETGLEILSRASSVPVFGYADQQMGLGIVGGFLTELEGSGVLGAEAAARLLKGESPDAIQSVFLPLAGPVFDQRELDRWGLPHSGLPEGSQFRFVEPGLWETHGNAILLGTTVILLQSVLIWKLLQARRRSRELNHSLAARREELYHISRVNTFQVLSGALAHEINLPLGIILSNAQAGEEMLVRKVQDTSELSGIFSDIIAANRRATEVIRRIRGFVRQDSRSRQPVTAASLVSASVDLTREALRRAGVRIEVELPPDLPAVLCDPVEIQQVLVNLLLNASEAFEEPPPEKKTIQIHARVSGGGVRFEVLDNGCGLKGNSDHVFEPFVSGKENGLGLGLPICRAIIESHRGRIWAEDRTGGSAFYFELPLAENGHE